MGTFSSSAEGFNSMPSFNAKKSVTGLNQPEPACLAHHILGWVCLVLGQAQGYIFKADLNFGVVGVRA